MNRLLPIVLVWLGTPEEDAPTREPIRPKNGIYGFHHGCGHGRTSNGRK